MAYDSRPASRATTAERAGYRDFGFGADVSERIVTGIVVSVAVMIVALIAVLMGMS